MELIFGIVVGWIACRYIHKEKLLRQVCHNCQTLIVFNKPFFGSYHLCVTEEERQRILGGKQ